MGRRNFNGVDEMGSGAEQLGALDQGFAHELELEMFQIAQAAMDELRGVGGGGAGIVALLGQQHFQAATGGVAGDRGAMNAAADDDKVERFRGHDVLILELPQARGRGRRINCL